MGSSNVPLLIYYIIFGLIGTLILHLWKKKWWLGLIIGLAVALALITIFALMMGG